jgi:hypothetical protein
VRDPAGQALWTALAAEAKADPALSDDLRQWLVQGARVIHRGRILRTFPYGTPREMAALQTLFARIAARGMSGPTLGAPELLWSHQHVLERLKGTTAEAWRADLAFALERLAGPERDQQIADVVQDPRWQARVLPTEADLAAALTEVPTSARLALIRGGLQHRQRHAGPAAFGAMRPVRVAAAPPARRRG